MLKKIGIGFGILVGIILIAAFILLYSNDSFEAVLTEAPEEGITESDYLTRSQVDGNTVLTYPLDTTHGIATHQVLISEGESQGNDGLFVKENSDSGLLTNNDKTVAVVAGSDFHNGIIEVELNGSISPKASLMLRNFSRGFIGVCFRIADDVESFECFYLRPENGVTDDETRRNHAVQYISIPDWDFARFREEAPEQYENPAPIAPDTWHTVRIEVEDETAQIFIDDGAEPVLVVNDLKLGAENRGEVGLWVGPGTDAFFRNLTVTTFD